MITQHVLSVSCVCLLAFCVAVDLSCDADDADDASCPTVDASPRSYTFHEIPLKAGLEGNQGGARINEAGVVCGTLITTPDYGFVWDQTNGATYFNGGGPAGGEWSATDINDSGAVTGMYGGAGAWRGFVRRPDGSWTGLPGIPGYFEAGGAAINNSGTVVGGMFLTNYVMGPPFIWKPESGASVLPGFPNDSPATDVNDGGKVVGYTISGSSRSAWVHDSGTTTALPHLSGSYSQAAGINESGQVVGKSGSHPVLWNGDSVKDLGTLGGSSGDARAVNDSGVVVGSAKTADDVDHAFVWAKGSIQDLNNLTTLPAGWTLSSASDINNSGMITGWGYKSGKQRAFVLVPDAAP